MTPPASPDADGARYLLSSPTARRSLHVLSQHPDGLTSTELATRAGAHRVTTARILARLDQLGIVHASHPPGQRVGRSVTYTLDTAQLHLVAKSLGDSISPPEM